MNLWSPQSPDLTSSDFYLWGYLKRNVYMNNAHTLEELKQNTKTCIANISQAMLHYVSANMIWKMNLCYTEGISHFQHLLWLNTSSVNWWAHILCWHMVNWKEVTIRVGWLLAQVFWCWISEIVNTKFTDKKITKKDAPVCGRYDWKPWSGARGDEAMTGELGAAVPLDFHSAMRFSWG
jgi:hypothetical protein